MAKTQKATLSMEEELEDLTRRRIDSGAQLQSLMYENLALFGKELLKRHDWDLDDEIDAVRFHLMQKYHWTPSLVKSLSLEDLQFAIADEEFGAGAPRASGAQKSQRGVARHS